MFTFFFLRHKKPLSYSLAGETRKWSWVLVLLFTSWGAKDIHLSRKCVGCGSSLEPLTLNTPPGTKDATPMRVRLPDGMLPLWEGISIHLPTEKRLILQLKKGTGKLPWFSQEMQPECYIQKKLWEIVSLGTSTNQSNCYFITMETSTLCPKHYWG